MNDGEGRATGPEADSAQAAAARQRHISKQANRAFAMMGYSQDQNFVCTMRFDTGELSSRTSCAGSLVPFRHNDLGQR